MTGIEVRIDVRGDVSIFIPHDLEVPNEWWDANSPTRSTRIHCPQHGAQTYTERYDVEKGEWEWWAPDPKAKRRKRLTRILKALVNAGL